MSEAFFPLSPCGRGRGLLGYAEWEGEGYFTLIQAPLADCIGKLRYPSLVKGEGA